jgi:hypothetical protein
VADVENGDAMLCLGLRVWRDDRMSEEVLIDKFSQFRWKIKKAEDCSLPVSDDLVLGRENVKPFISSSSRSRKT